MSPEIAQWLNNSCLYAAALLLVGAALLFLWPRGRK